MILVQYMGYFCRDSSVVEHFHGKEGVLSSNLNRGSSSYSSPDKALGLFAV